MVADRWQRLHEVFHAAVALDPAARPGYVAQACLDDDALRVELDELLRSHDRAELELGEAERLEAALNESALPGAGRASSSPEPDAIRRAVAAPGSLENSMRRDDVRDPCTGLCVQ